MEDPEEVPDAAGEPAQTQWPAIRKDVDRLRVLPNLVSYEAARAAFSWTEARTEVEGLPGGGLNIAHEAVDRHALGKHAERLAIRWLSKDLRIEEYTYARLRTLSNRFANVLKTLGVERGDRVFALAGRIPELYIAAIGTLKCGAVFSPLFSAFGPEPVHARMSIGGVKVLLTTPTLYERKVAQLRDRLPELQHAPAAGAK